MASKKLEDAQPQAQSLVKCRVLSDCAYGNWGEVVEVEKCVAEQAPFLDPHPESVAYAEEQLALKAAETPAE